MESLPKLFSDMVFEVLSKSCLIALDSSRLVCKEWNKLTYDPNFIRSHALNTKIVSGFVVQTCVYGKYKSRFISLNSQEVCNDLSFDFLPVANGEVRIEASSDQGLFVCVGFQRTGYRLFRYYICKACTKEFVSLPNPKTRYPTQATALVVLAANPLQFKIIRLSCPKEQMLHGNTRYRCEIFDSAKWKWIESKEIICSDYEFVNIEDDPAICARGLVYFRTSKGRVLAFDIISENYNIFPLPQPVFENKDWIKNQRLAKYEGKLGFSCTTSNNSFELWILKTHDTNESSWNKPIILTTKVLEEREKYPILMGFCNSDVAIVRGCTCLIFYNIKSYDLHKEECGHCPRQTFSFRSDFEPCFRKSRMLG